MYKNTNMSFVYIKTFVILVFLTLFFLYISAPGKLFYKYVGRNMGKNKIQGRESVHIATVICGDRLEEGVVMLKSAVIFSSTHIVFHIFAEELLRQNISNKINRWPDRDRRRLDINLYKIQFPTSQRLNKTGHWGVLYKPCAAQRLFFPEILSNVDSVIYLDTDIIFLTPVEDLWAQFNKFNSSQMIGVVPDLLYWKPHKTLGGCTPTGINSGVMLMNLTRIRSTSWKEKMQEYFIKHRDKLKHGDQDLINIYCYFFPSQFYFMSCSWNYNHFFCKAESKCKEKKVYILHGIMGYFHRRTAVAAVYKAVKQYNLTRNTERDLYDTITLNVKNSQGFCRKRTHLFTHYLEKYIPKNDRNDSVNQLNRTTTDQPQMITKKTTKRAQTAINKTTNRPQMITKKITQRAQTMTEKTTQRAQTMFKKTTQRVQTMTKKTTQRAQTMTEKTTQRSLTMSKKIAQGSQTTTRKTTK